MKRFKLTVLLAVTVGFAAASMASGADLWPVPNSPFPQASGTANTGYGHANFVDSWGNKIYRIKATTEFAFQGLAPGGRYVLVAYSSYGSNVANIGVGCNPDGTASGVVYRLYDNIALKFVRSRYYELWTADDHGNPAMPVVLSSQ